MKSFSFCCLVSPFVSIEFIRKIQITLFFRVYIKKIVLNYYFLNLLKEDIPTEYIKSIFFKVANAICHSSWAHATFGVDYE